MENLFAALANYAERWIGPLFTGAMAGLVEIFRPIIKESLLKPARDVRSFPQPFSVAHGEER